MALYGYKESPRLWANFRDDELQKLEVPMDDGGHLTLDQMVTEPNMWRIIKKQPGPFAPTQAEQFCGLLLVYVDDLLIMGKDEITDLLIRAVQAKWETSIPEIIDDCSGVRFLGAELFKQGDRWWMTQKNYIQDLLARNLGAPPWHLRKIPMLAEPEVREDPPHHDLETTREAQRVVGELVWIATRTRPDLAFAITKLASMITKDPQQVIDLTKNVWHYLANTSDHGLQFENQPGERQRNIYTDASFGEVSMGCHSVMWGTSMLLWKAGKQSVITASTAESELVEILEGALAGDAVRVVMEELLGITARAVSFTDNTAAVSIVTGDSGSWRTRHLRKRANVLRSKVNLGEWLLRHMPGSELPADLGTKVLSFEKFNFFKRLMGMFMGVEGKEEKKNEDERNEKETKDLPKVEAVKKALKAIILFARLAKAKGDEDEKIEKAEIQLWQPSFPIVSFSDPMSGASLRLQPQQPALCALKLQRLLALGVLLIKILRLLALGALLIKILRLLALQLILLSLLPAGRNQKGLLALALHLRALLRLLALLTKELLALLLLSR
eukprot:s4682_g7.t1